MNLDDLIKTDESKKKNFHLAKEGLFVHEGNVEGLNKEETLKRQNHLNEKLIKMQNPNMKISQTKIVLKNVAKNLDK